MTQAPDVAAGASRPLRGLAARYVRPDGRGPRPAAAFLDERSLAASQDREAGESGASTDRTPALDRIGAARA